MTRLVISSRRVDAFAEPVGEVLRSSSASLFFSIARRLALSSIDLRVELLAARR